MKVYIDVSGVMDCDKITGVPRVAINVVSRLIEKNNVFDIVLLRYVESENLFEVIDNKSFVQKLLFNKQESFQYCNIGKKVNIKDIKYGDVLFDLDSVWNSKIKRSYLYKNIKKQGAIICVFVYDIIPIVVPEFSTSDIIYRFIPFIGSTLKYADRIIVNTNNTKKDIDEICDILKIRKKKIDIIPLSPGFQVKDIHEANHKLIKLVKSKKYLLQVGTIEPRKNHNYVLDAFDEGLEQCDVNYIVVGKKGWDEDKIYNRIKNHRLYNKRIFLFENLDDDALRYLYKNAYLSVFPSFYEGYGMPIIESMVNNTPVLVADVPILKEVGANYCEYFSLDNPYDLVDLVKKYIRDSDYYNERKKFISSYKTITWEEITEKVCKVLKDTKSLEKGEIGTKKISEVVDIILRKDTNSLGEEQFLENVVQEEEIVTDFDIRNIDDATKRVNKYFNISYYRMLNSNRKILGKPIIFAKRIVRKLFKWLIEPIILQQREFNAATTEIINDLRNKIIVMESNAAVTKIKFDLQKELLDSYQNMFIEMQDRIKEQQNEFDEFNKAIELTPKNKDIDQLDLKIKELNDFVELKSKTVQNNQMKLEELDKVIETKSNNEDIEQIDQIKQIKLKLKEIDDFERELSNVLISVYEIRREMDCQQ